MRTKTLEGSSAQDFAGLQVDLLQKLRDGNITYNQIEWFKNLTFGQREELMGLLIKKESLDPKPQNSIIIIRELFEEFNPQQRLIKNKSVKYWKEGDFNKYVLSPAKIIINLPEMFFKRNKFTGIITDKEIMERFQISESTGLMTREEILWTIDILTSKQPNGEEGDLLNNGHPTIIGHLLCDDGFIRSARVYWDSSCKRWRCECDMISGWRGGVEMLNRATVSELLKPSIRF